MVIMRQMIVESHEGNVMSSAWTLLRKGFCIICVKHYFFIVLTPTLVTPQTGLWTPPVTPAAGVQAALCVYAPMSRVFPLSLFPLTVFSSECRANTQALSGFNKSHVSGGWPLTSVLVDRSFSTGCIFASAWGSEFPPRLLLVHGNMLDPERCSSSEESGLILACVWVWEWSPNLRERGVTMVTVF